MPLNTINKTNQSYVPLGKISPAMHIFDLFSLNSAIVL